VLSAVGPSAPELDVPNLMVVCTGQQEISKDHSPARALIQGLWNSKAARALDSILQASDSSHTVVHIHGWTKALSSSVVRTALDRGFKVVCTLHDYFPACPNGGFYNYQSQAICRLQPMSSACLLTHCDKRHYSHKVWRVARQFIQSQIGGMPGGIRHFIAVSDWSRTILTPFLPPAATIYELKNPIAVPLEPPVGVKNNSAYVMLGRISHEKGPYLFAEAARELGYQAMFIGDGESRRDVLRLNPDARVTGWVGHSQILSHLRQARVLVFPSLWYETDGLAVVEAAALGIPVIVADTSAARNSVVDGTTGLWFTGGNRADLMRKMRALRNDDDLVTHMGLAAHEHYWKNPRTLTRHVEELECVYERILNPERFH